MDELKFKMKSSQLKLMLSTLIAKTISKKTGTKVFVKVNDISIETNDDGRINLHIDLDGNLKQEDLYKLIQNNVFKN